MLRASNNGWKDGTGCIITRKAGLAHTRTIINNESLVGGKKKKEKEWRGLEMDVILVIVQVYSNEVNTIIFSYYPIKVKPHDRFLYQSKGRRINKDEDKKTWPSFFS